MLYVQFVKIYFHGLISGSLLRTMTPNDRRSEEGVKKSVVRTFLALERIFFKMDWWRPRILSRLSTENPTPSFRSFAILWFIFDLAYISLLLLSGASRELRPPDQPNPLLDIVCDTRPESFLSRLPHSARPELSQS